MERSFAAEVKQLALGEGQVLRGEGILGWERAVLEAAVLDYGLGCEVAELATVVKGYGEVRRRLSRGLRRILDEVVVTAVSRDRESGQGYARAVEAVRDARRRMLEDEKGLEAVLGPSGALEPPTAHGR